MILAAEAFFEKRLAVDDDDGLPVNEGNTLVPVAVEGKIDGFVK